MILSRSVNDPLVSTGSDMSCKTSVFPIFSRWQLESGSQPGAVWGGGRAVRVWQRRGEGGVREGGGGARGGTRGSQPGDAGVCGGRDRVAGGHLQGRGQVVRHRGQGHRAPVRQREAQREGHHHRHGRAQAADTR